jgi:CrcB protein
MWWQKLIWLSVAGAVGTLSRFGLQGLVQGSRVGFPWGTFAVNIAGTFAFGVVWSLADRTVVSPEFKTYALIGFMGAFTTFSTFMFESGSLIQDREYLLAGANMLGQNVTGIIFLFLGLALGRLL